MAKLQSSSSANDSCIDEVDTIMALAKGAEQDGLVKSDVLDQLFSFDPQVPYSTRYGYLLSSFVKLLNQMKPSSNMNQLLKHQMEVDHERVEVYSLFLLLIGPKVTSEAQTLALAQEAVRNGLIDPVVLKQLSSFHPQVPTPTKYRYLLACFSTKLQKLQKEVMISYKAMHFLCYHNINVPPVVCDPEDTILGPDQLSYLLEKLVSCAHKWKSIGTLLKFHAGDLSNIEVSTLLMPGAPQSYLQKLLEDWLLQNMKHAQLPTVGNLKRALNSETVGLGTVASSLTDSIASSLPFKVEVALPYSVIKVSLNMSAASQEGEPEFTCTGNDHVQLEENELTLLEVQLEVEDWLFEHKYRWLENDTPMVGDGGTCPAGFSSPSLCIKADIDADNCKFSCQVSLRYSRLERAFQNNPRFERAFKAIAFKARAKPRVEFASFKTNPVVLNISCSLDEYRGRLAAMYLAQPEVPQDKWPPVSNKKHINLALIKQQEVNYNSRYTRYTIRGDADDILQHKEIIEYRDVYKSFKSGQLVLVEGRPGSGKTTFIHKLSRDWAASPNGAIRLMFSVSLRVLNSYPNPGLSDILDLFRDLRVSADHIEKRGGKGVCFLFDGLDEFSPLDGENSIVYKLINKEYLCESTVVVASRPAAIAMFRYRANRIVEVLGFLSDQILEYFDYYPFSHNTKPAELKTYLPTHPNVFHMCYLPIHAAMVAFLFDVTGEVPKTETEIYQHFTRFTLMRSLSKSKEFGVITEIKDTNSLSGKEQNCFKQICRLAFEKTVDNKQVLDQDEVRSYFQIKEDIDISLGLLTIDCTAGLYGIKNIYTFLHLTFQEFLAARHLCTLSKEEQSRLIQELGDKKHMLVVWKFYCGLVTFKPYENLFKSILCRTEGNDLYQIQCAYESQQKIVCVQYLKAVCKNIKIASKYLNIPDFTAIGYIVNMMTKLPIKLTLLNCNFGIEEVDALLSEIRAESRQLLQGLHIEVETVDAVMMECMKKLFANLGQLDSFFLKATMMTTFFDPTVGDQPIKLTKLSLINVDITPLLPLIDLQALQVIYLEGRTSGYLELFDHLNCCSNLKELNIRDVKISEECAKALRSNLPACRCLERIIVGGVPHIEEILRSLQENSMKIAAEDIHLSTTSLTFQLKHFTNLKSLDIYLRSSAESHSFKLYSANWSKLEELRIRIGTWDFAIISNIFDSLPNFKELTVLALGNVIARLEDVKLLMASLQCPDLQVLDLSNNNTGPEEATALAHHLVNLGSLKELVLNNNRIGDGGAKTISSHFQHYQNLQALGLAGNGIGSDGGMELAANLHHCTLLQTLDIQGNHIGDKAAHAIASSLQHCTNFKTLYLSQDACDFFVQTYRKQMHTKEKIFKFEVIFL